MAQDVSSRRRREVINALRRGTVPESGLDLLAVGLDRFVAAIDEVVGEAVALLLEQRLGAISSRTPVFAQALRGYRSAVAAGDSATADGLAAWMRGQPQVAASAKRAAGIRGELDHFGAMGF